MVELLVVVGLGVVVVVDVDVDLGVVVVVVVVVVEVVVDFVDSGISAEVDTSSFRAEIPPFSDSLSELLLNIDLRVVVLVVVDASVVLAVVEA